MTNSPPKIDNAPGLKWRARANGKWEARWRPRRDLVGRGYPKTLPRLWLGTVAELDDMARKWIVDRCNVMQGEMLLWGGGGLPIVGGFDGTLRGLIVCYQNDKDSPFHKIRYHSRKNYTRLLKRIVERHGDAKLEEIKVRVLIGWHQEWSAGGKVSMGHGFIAMLRTVINFGATYYEDEHCERISGVLHRQRFKMAKPRDNFLTAEQADAVRNRARATGWKSVALAQAFQFEGTLRQKDIIGEWVPYEEPGTSEVHNAGMKWLRGIRWTEIDAALILRHNTSKREKDVVIDLKLAPMVLDELARAYPGAIQITEEEIAVRRNLLPTGGPVIVNETINRPFTDTTFRIRWRKIAGEVGVPVDVYNMDSRAGAITEATDSGAELEDIRHAATHGDIAMTQKYSRGGEAKTAKVMRLRVAHRNKSGTN